MLIGTERATVPGPVGRRAARPAASAAAALAVLALLGVLSVLALAPPDAKSAAAAEQEFAAGRAEEHLRAIAQRPHPVGTEDNARVRDYVVTAARSAGASVEVESGDVVLTDYSPITVATVHNVVAKVPGNDPAAGGGKALLLVSHYDSVPTGPGAADDGAAVAAMLEAIRVLKASGGVRNDVVFLFTDGEELGLLGAEMSVRRHGVEGYGAVANWEARGSNGPVLLFETSVGNAGLIDAYAAGGRPAGNSLAYEVYRRMPNASDFKVFREAGAAGINAAFIGGVHDYHSPHDDIGRVDRDSVQHHGDSMMGVIRTLGDDDLRQLSRQDSVYFDLFARVLVHYPVWLAVTFASLSLLILVALLVIGARRNALRMSAVAGVAGAGTGAVLMTATVCYGLWQLVMSLRPGLAALPLAEPYDRPWFIAGFALLALAVLLALAGFLRRFSRAELIGGASLLSGVLLAVAVALVPGASFLLQWPVAAGLVALWWAVRDRGRADDWAAVLLTAAGPAVAVVLFTPLVSNLLTALGIPLTAVAMALAMIAAVLLLPLLTALPRIGLLTGVAAVAAAALLTTSVLLSDFDSDEPRPDALLYLHDSVTGVSSWVTGDDEPDDWTSRVLGARPETTDLETDYPDLDAPLLRAPAPPVELAAPTVTTLADSTTGAVRTLRFRVASPRGAWKLQVGLDRERFTACFVAGHRVGADWQPSRHTTDRKVFFEIYGKSGGAELSCEVPAGTTLPVEVADFSIGLPPQVASLVGPRPADTTPVSYGFRPEDTAIVRVVVRL